jgi:hypothetical protein
LRERVSGSNVIPASAKEETGSNNRKNHIERKDFFVFSAFFAVKFSDF